MNKTDSHDKLIFFKNWPVWLLIYEAFVLYGTIITADIHIYFLAILILVFVQNKSCNIDMAPPAAAGSRPAGRCPLPGSSQAPSCPDTGRVPRFRQEEEGKIRA